MPKDIPPRHDSAPSSTPHQEIDYTPKNYTLGEHAPIFLKFIAIAGFIFLIFWFYESK